MKNPLSKPQAKPQKDYAILTDTACDLSQNMLDNLGITALPMHVLIDGEDYMHYADYHKLGRDEFYEKLKDCKEIKTTQVDSEAATTAMRELIEAGKDIIYISFSSGLSGTYSTVLMIAEELKEEYPQARINVIDSLCASGGEGLLICLAAKQKEQGADFDTLSNWIEENKLRVCHWFTVNDLQHLKRGGRISATTAAFGGLLSIKPVMHMDDEGHLTPNSKCAGRKKALEALVDKMDKHTKGKKFDHVFISHSMCLDEAEIVKEKLNQRFKIGDITIVDIDPIIAAHTGAGCIALFFIGKER